MTNMRLSDAPPNPNNGRMTQPSGLLDRALATDNDRTLLAQRVALGLIMFPHGAQKLLGWFGGFGLSSTLEFLTGTVHLPAPLAVLVILAESLGAVGLVLGAGTRLAALGIASVMLGAIATTHLPFGLFMDWFGTQHGEGFEYHLLVLALALPLAVRGAGALSLDRALAARLRAAATTTAMPQPSRA